MLNYKKEMQAGQVPVVRIAPFRTFTIPEYGTFGAFVLEPLGWVDYDSDQFGEAINDSPLPILSGPARAAQIEAPDNDNDHDEVGATSCGGEDGGASE